ncbi:CRS1 / YhbY (CRM) domain-containing protein [Euphorbia peplus]|nr:CRS1 / YhbY (CRM) domain-containing protein [Euphorbia peplus]
MDMAIFIPSSNPSLHPHILQPKHPPTFKASNFKITCSSRRSNSSKTPRKPRPSFSELIHQKWSLKNPSSRQKFPWQEQKILQKEEEDEEEKEDIERPQISQMDASSIVDDNPVSTSVTNPVIKAPWVHGKRIRIPNWGNSDLSEENVDKGESLEKGVYFGSEFGGNGNVVCANDDLENPDKGFKYNVKLKDESVKLGAGSVKLVKDKGIARVGGSRDGVLSSQREHRGVEVFDDNYGSSKHPDNGFKYNVKLKNESVKLGAGSVKLVSDKGIARVGGSRDGVSLNWRENGGIEVSDDNCGSSSDLENPDEGFECNVKLKDESVKLGAGSIKLVRDKGIARVGGSRDGVFSSRREHRGVEVFDDNYGSSSNLENLDEEFECNVKLKDESVKLGVRDKEMARVSDSRGGVSLDWIEQWGIEVSDYDNGSLSELPWKREKKVDNVEGDLGMKKSNSGVAEKILPEHELKRLRNISLRMFERIKVGAAGITRDLVDTIHKKWRLEEVVKLKFEEPFASNMKRTHEMLESRTGGLVIWRSGSSVVLYRGISYKLQCVQSFSEQNVSTNNSLSHPKEAASNLGVKDSSRTIKPIIPDCAKYLKDLSQEELTQFSELNQLLDELGPRFTDWCGREPFPIDADLLPGIDPQYKPPLRLLPFGVRRTLTNKEMTVFRRVARTMPPHFALGRNRELQGLAMAMVKLWEKTAIAKIAIKRGVLNTRNERMAEELRVLTGGTLLSRNKEFIVFYRGNDFLPPAIMGNLRERKKQTYLKQDEEEQARNKALTFVSSNEKTSQSQGPLVAGTLAETMAATSRWSIQHGSEEVDKMRREASLARRASLIRNLQNRLHLARGKMTKAEKGIAKVEEHMEPSGLPSDLETISDEERFLFRKIGLSMKPYLLLGRRGVYDGTIENMHLHWKYREVVKVMVSRKSLPQVRHIATALETESGGILVSVERTMKGYAIIIYRGKNYQRPNKMRPANLLTKRQALARSIELQRREALKHHISDLEERIELVKSELEEETESSEKISA